MSQQAIEVILARQLARAGDLELATGSVVPKVMYTDSASEYWRGDAFLAHARADDGSDVDLPANVRRYVFASTQHGPGLLPLNDVSVFGSRGGNNFNIIDYTPIFRAALINLETWVAQGVEPPPSELPSHRAGTAAERSEVIARLAGIASLRVPDPAVLPAVYPLDLGPLADSGIGKYPAGVAGPAYPCFVSCVDEAGNELAGVRMPDVTVPVATHTGWNPRHHSSGGDGQLLDYLGSTVPLPLTEAQRGATGDPRPSLESLYRDRADYETKVRDAALALVSRRFLLPGDVELCVKLALRRYDAVRATQP